jgi:hypothetical protein
VLKALALVLARVLPVSPRCTHVKGNGGPRAAVRQVSAALAANRFVLRTDVKSYYASIDHLLLMDRLARSVGERNILNLLGQYLRRTAESGGWFWDCERGISLGCPLSPLIGAFFLDQLDRRMIATGLFYVRFMDDILVLAPTRWKLRRAVTAVNEILGSLRLQKHPDKTFIGRIERGFDFVGYHFSRAGLRLAEATIQNSSNVQPGFTSRGGSNQTVPPGLGCMSDGGSVGRRVGCRRAERTRKRAATLGGGRPPPKPPAKRP